MGPVISTAHRDKIEGYMEVAKKDGATIAIGGKRPEREGFQLRRLAVEMGTPCLTSLDTAREVLRVVANRKDDANYNVEALQDFELE